MIGLKLLIMKNRREFIKKSSLTILATTLSPQLTFGSKKDVKIVAAAPFSMDIFSYPHREGAKMTFSLILEWLSSDDCNIDEYHMLVLATPPFFLPNLQICHFLKET